MTMETTYRGITGGTLFTGFGLCDVGMAAAGIKAAWGVERDGAIAEVARANGLPVTTADVLACDPSRFEYVDVLHASPPCPNFSQAKTGGRETPLDVALGEKTAGFVEALRPTVFTLENVWGYRKSESWRAVYRTLRRLGYGVGFARLNAADYSVPQTRERMIVWAVRSGEVLPAPTPTHAEAPPAAGLFGDALRRWNGWYGAVEDLLPTLPDSELAPWQLKRLPEELRTLLVHGTSDMAVRDAGSPAACVVATVHEKAAATVGSAQRPGNAPRAVLVSGDSIDGGDVALRDGGRPAVTLSTKADRMRALLYAPGVRVVQMTPRALARFQTLPDWYALPDSRTLACRGIGNGVPCDLVTALYLHLLARVDFESLRRAA